MARRQLEIGAAVEAWRARGGLVAFGTVTMRHWSGHRLADLWTALSKAWGKVTSGKAWQTDKSRHQIAGWLRVVETTDGENGWHVHVHFLLFLEAGLVAPDLEALEASMFGRWERALVRAGLPRPLRKGQDLHLLDGAADEALTRYFTKAVFSARRIGLELTSTQTKKARGVHGTRSVWALLDDVLDLGDADSLDRWHEWQKASKGRRQLTWSRGLREQLGLRVEKSDEEVAGEELGTSADDLVLITAAGWRRVLAAGIRAALLDVLEGQGLGGVRAMLDHHRVEYSLVGEAVDAA